METRAALRHSSMNILSLNLNPASSVPASSNQAQTAVPPIGLPRRCRRWAGMDNLQISPGSCFHRADRREWSSRVSSFRGRRHCCPSRSGLRTISAGTAGGFRRATTTDLQFAPSYPKAFVVSNDNPARRHLGRRGNPSQAALFLMFTDACARHSRDGSRCRGSKTNGLSLIFLPFSVVAGHIRGSAGARSRKALPAGRL